MIVFLFLALALCCPCAEGAGAPSGRQDSLDQANDLYRAGEYEQALGRYEILEMCGGDAGVLAFNRGNCHFRLGRYGEALCEYLSAEINRPGDSRISWNIEVARERLGSELSVDAGFVDRFRRTVGIARADEYRTLGALLVSAFLLVAAAFFRKGKNPTRRWWAFLLLPGLVIYALSIPVAEGPRGSIAVVVRDAALVFNEPSERADALFSLREGEIVRVLERDEEWIRVEDGENHRGWARNGPVREVRRHLPWIVGFRSCF